MNMNDWCNNVLKNKNKRALPIITFPAASKLQTTVRELINSVDLQVNALKIIKKECEPLAIIGFMDLSVEAECFGAKLEFYDNEVPTIRGQLIKNMEDAEVLQIPKIESGRTHLYLNTIKQIKEDIVDIPVFGGCIGPFSLAGRLMGVSEAIINCYDDPEMVHLVLQKVTSFLINYIRAYKSIGADGIFLAEPLAGVLSPVLATKFSSKYVKEIVDELQDEDFIVIYHNCGNNTLKMINDFKMINAKAYHFGNAIDLKDMLENLPKNFLVMGNIDPVEIISNGTSETVKQVTRNLLNSCKEYPNFIISSGCDIPPLASWANIKTFMETSRNYYENNS